MDKNVFNPPKQPRNGLELLKWVIFEPILLRNFESVLLGNNEKILDEKQTIILLKAYAWISLISLSIYILKIFVIVTFDLLTQYPNFFREELLNEWSEKWYIWEKFKIYFFKHLTSVTGDIPRRLINNIREPLLISGMLGLNVKEPLLGKLSGGLIGGLYIAFSIGFFIYLIFSLRISLLFGLVFSVAISLGIGLEVELENLMLGSFILGNFIVFFLSLAVRNLLIEKKVKWLIDGILMGQVGSMLAGISVGIIGMLIFIIGWNLLYFRIPFYLYHFIKSFFITKLDNNIYLKDEEI